MAEAKQFGQKLRELRIAARLTQRQLAEKIGVDFSYLSKIENGALPPPSEKLILRLAEVLNADKDELLILAGKIPADIAQILKNREALRWLRSRQTARKKETPFWQSLASLTKIRMPSIDFKNVAKVAIAITLVMAIGVSLWFASPTRALQVDITPPPTGDLGTTHSFTVIVTIEDLELLPLKTIDMYIYNVATPTYKATLSSLPFNTGSKSFTSAETGGGSATVSATAGFGWFYTTGAGYVYWQGTAYTWAAPVGGYAYAYTPGSTSITYNVAWISPSGWPTGNYKIDVKLTAIDDRTFIKTSSAFNITAPVPPAVLPPPPPPPVTVTVSVANIVTPTGEFTQTVTATSRDANLELVIPRGTIGLIEGRPLTQITITQLPAPPTPILGVNVVNPAGEVVAPAGQPVILGIPYDLGPDGATFDRPVSITFRYDPALIPAGLDEDDLVPAFFDAARGVWVTVDDFTIDPAANTITARITHFTKFAVLAPNRPAIFTISDLVISPAEVNVGERVTISVKVANVGDKPGTYKVTFKLEGKVVETKEVSLDDDTSQTVTFTTVQTTAGTYSVDVNGLTGRFVVKLPPVPPPPPVTPPPVTPPPPPVIPPPPPVTPPPPPPVTPPPPVVPPPPNWALIGGIIAAVIIVGIVIWLILRRRQY